MNTRDLWSGDFGTEYTKRNRVDWQARVPFWASVIRRTTGDIRRAPMIMELGCNAGWNLRAIREATPYSWLTGCDLNAAALEEARQQFYVRQASGNDLPFATESFDLCFTVGVLIHVPMSDLRATVGELIRCSSRWVLAVEYESKTGDEEEIPYRGLDLPALWRRDYGKIYQEQGLTLVEKWDAGPAFDRCTSWLLRKG